ncbi:E3 ubiquitin-protein ligase RNF183 [Frankliniella fusca]|uniref:E3 ubiquitin-protein ligase RNF183 n=1 Tax=Frankliniella fusca TaxID=407009 RepID=A0AAE1LCK7_9NEOP|nr:E3 ubiquitin-protein ligase RNF183 [Frankliniella fusca]
MEFQCDICFFPFNLNRHRPKMLPCGHTICAECVLNPGLQMKCPSCRKVITGDPGNLPDNILAIRMIEYDGIPPLKMAKTEETKVQRLRRGLDTAREALALLRLQVPRAIEGLNRLLDSSADRVRQMETSLRQEVQREAGRECEPPSTEAAPDGDADPDPLQVALWMDECKKSLRLLSCPALMLDTLECSIGAEEDVAKWRASVKLGPNAPLDSLVRLLLLQLQWEKELKQVTDAGLAVLPADPRPYVGPPLGFALTRSEKDVNDGELMVNEILRGGGGRWKRQRIRSLRNLQEGRGQDKLLRVVGPFLEELEITGNAEPAVMAEVEKMTALKRLSVRCSETMVEDYPGLPLQLEELSLVTTSKDQMLCVQRMPKLRSLAVLGRLPSDMDFPPSPHGSLLWLGVGCSTACRDPMLQLIRSYGSSLQELHIFCCSSREEYEPLYFADLGQDLASCGLRALRRLVLVRGLTNEHSKDVASCVLQRRTMRGFLPSVVDVICDTCSHECQMYA